MSRARRTLPDKPPLALPIGPRLRRRALHGVNDVQPREHQEMAECVDNGARTHAPTVHRPRAYRSIRQALGVAAISLAGNSNAARRSAQRGILAGPPLTLLLSTSERCHQSAA